MFEEQWYKPSNDTLYGKGCLKHKITKELTIFGKYGMVWENNSNSFNVLCYNSQYVYPNLCKLLNIKGDSVVKGDEKRLLFDIKYLDQVIKLIKVPSQTGRQRNFIR